MNTYGVHGIHGRAPALATGLALARPDLSIWVVSGDGDALSIGGNHLIHALRRNVPIKILLFNNQIYGLTKGQYSPTSEEGKVTKSTPFGSLDHPFNPVALALGAEASFVARTVDTDRDHEAEVLRAAAEHEGSALIEIYQNCNVFNDGAFDAVRGKGKEANQIRLEHGSPIRFGAEGERGVVRGPERRAPESRSVADVGEDAAARPRRRTIRTRATRSRSPTSRAAQRAHADRGLPRGRAPGLRRGAWPGELEAAREGARHRGARRAPALRRHLDGRLAARSPSSARWPLGRHRGLDAQQPRRACRGRTQFQRPNSDTTAGTSSARITVASSRIPAASPVANIFRSVPGPEASETNARNRISAALVTRRPVRPIPRTTAVRVSPDSSYSSRIRVRMNTS